MPEITVKKGEPIDRALKRLKARIEAESSRDEHYRIGSSGTLKQTTRQKAKTASKGKKYRFQFAPGHHGVVHRCVHGFLDDDTAQDISLSKLIEALKVGLGVQELDELRSSLDLPMERLGPMLGISKATLHRRKTAGKLDMAESDRVVRFARLLGRAASVMDSLENGRRWLMSP